MEKKNFKLKNDFSHLIGQVSKLYKEVSNSNTESYNLGKKEAYEEMLNWFVNSHNGELKYVSATSFLHMVQEKISKVKSALNNKNTEDPLPDDSVKQLNFSDIKVSDNRKRINRYAAQESLQNFNEPQMIDDQISIAGTQYNSGGLPSSNQGIGTMSGITYNITGERDPVNIFNACDNGSNMNNVFANNLQPSLFVPNKKKKFR